MERKKNKMEENGMKRMEKKEAREMEIKVMKDRA